MKVLITSNAKSTAPSFPRRRESSVSNNFREADKTALKMWSHFAGIFLNHLDSRLRGNDGGFEVSVVNFEKVRT
ncbi:MAG: hypothetical protein ACYCY7_15025 [Gallionella sp.]